VPTPITAASTWSKVKPFASLRRRVLGSLHHGASLIADEALAGLVLSGHAIAASSGLGLIMLLVAIPVGACGIASIRAAKADGIKLGEAVAAKVLEARANDGHDAVDDYRPRTTPGVIPISAGSADFAVEPGMGS
jgi:hypothetical protein